MRKINRFIPFVLVLIAAPVLVLFQNFTTRTPPLIPLSAVPASQVAPTVAATLSLAQLTQILNEASGSAVYATESNLLTANADGSNTMSAAPLQIVQTNDPQHPYLGLFQSLDATNHALFNSYLTFSRDLITWQTIGPIHHAAGMPSLKILPDNSVLLAEEWNPTGKRPFVELTYYGNVSGTTGLQRFISNPASAVVAGSGIVQFKVPQTSNSSADGTPEVSAITYNGSISTSQIVLSYHTYPNGGMDTEALGTIANFNSYSNLGLDTLANAALKSAGASGQHGGRSFFYVGAQLYEIVEGNLTNQDFGSWSLYLLQRDQAMNVTAAVRLRPALVGGAGSMGNPHITFLKLPNGQPALVSTMFVFSQNAGSTPAGGHVRITQLGPPPLAWLPAALMPLNQ